MISVVVTYSQSEFDRKYEELRQYKVTLPKDPISLGFSGLADLIATLQGYKDRVSELWSESSKLKTHAKIQAEIAESEYQTALDLLMNQDVEVINMPSDRTRLAKANKKLQAELSRIHETKMIQSLMDVYHRTVTNVYNNLESANDNLSEQVQIYKRMNPPTSLGFDQQPASEPRTSGVSVSTTV